MLRRLIKLPSYKFSSSQTDSLVPLHSKLLDGQGLRDYEYLRMIEDQLKKKELLPAYNLLIHSYLDNVLLDKQIFTKLEQSITQFDQTFAQVLHCMFLQQFKYSPTIQNKVKAQQKTTDGKTKESTIKVEENLKQSQTNKFSVPKKFLKQGELLFEDVMKKVDFQKINFKNVTINFDYEWLGQFQDIDPSPSLQGLDNQSQHLEDDQVQISNDQQEESSQQEFTLQDILRSIKSIEIGEVEFSVDKNKK